MAPCDPGSLRNATEFMACGVTLKPVFLIQFNVSATPDEGDEANSNDETGPWKQWGSGLRADIDHMCA